MYENQAATYASVKNGVSRRDTLKSLALGVLGCSIAATAGSTTFGQEKHAGKPKTYELPSLPYGYGELAPGIEEGVLRIHHTKHHAGYVNGLNTVLGQLDQARRDADYSRIKALSRALAFHASGHVLHALYWNSMRPNGSAEPTGNLRHGLERDFGSFKAFIDQFAAAAVKVEGSGWAVLVYEPRGGRLLILQAEKHQNLAIWGATPLLVCDVWEHAYYAQYHNRRGDYVTRFVELIDWPAAGIRYSAALGRE